MNALDRRILEEYDFNDIAGEIVRRRYFGSIVGLSSRIRACFDQLRDVPFPPGYLDSLVDDMVKAASRRADEYVNVYLAFYGFDAKASMLKIGVAGDVRKRLATIRTGNPTPLLWSYSAPFVTRADALKVESALLQHMRDDSLSGEWINVHGISESAAAAIVASLAEVAGEIDGYKITFARRGSQ